MPRVIECLAWLGKISEDREFDPPFSEALHEAERYIILLIFFSKIFSKIKCYCTHIYICFKVSIPKCQLEKCLLD